MYDIIILGAGPAGMTAAVYAARKKLKTLVISKNTGGQAALSGSIENYTGYQLVSGIELSEKFHEHLHSFEVEHREQEEALSVEKVGEVFRVKTGKGGYSSKTVLFCLGGEPRPLKATGEEKFKNRGVTYCATCDAPLFAGKDVAVIGGGNSALDACLQLMEIAGKIYLITTNERMMGDPVMMEKVQKSGKVEILTNTQTREFIGDKFLTGLRVSSKEGSERLLNVEGAFIEIGWMPVSVPFKADVELKCNQYGEIVVNDRCETNMAGVFAAGDVTSVPEKQIIVAAGQGCIAALSAFKYLSKKVFKEV